MRTYSKLILAALAASAFLAIAVSGATARSLRVNERNFETIWNETLGATKTKLKFTVPGRTPVACRVTMLGHFNESTIVKETLRNQNTITHAELESCTNGTATIRTETLPWTSRYRSFGGTLPRIREIKIGLIGATFKIREAGGLECEAGTEVNHPAVGIAGNSSQAAETGLETTGEAEDITAEPVPGIPLGGGFLCAFAGEGNFEGVGLIRNLPRTGKIRVTLI